MEKKNNKRISSPEEEMLAKEKEIQAKLKEKETARLLLSAQKQPPAVKKKLRFYEKSKYNDKSEKKGNPSE